MPSAAHLKGTLSVAVTFMTMLTHTELGRAQDTRPRDEVLAPPHDLAPASQDLARAAQKIQFRDGFPVTSRAKLYPFDKVQRGDRGIGYTVFEEDRLVPFGVEILGIMRGMLGPGRDVILARLTGPEIDFTGVISGMSGSPVFIDGKLLGAVAYRFGVFAKEPIAGITPIQSMLDIEALPRPEGERMADSRALLTRFRQRTAQLAPANAKTHRPLPAPNLTAPPYPARTTADASFASPEGMRPIDTPIMIGGLDDHARASLVEALASRGLEPTPGAVGFSGSAKNETPRTLASNGPSFTAGVRAAPIAPGAPIAALLVRGDILVAAVGTVTMVEDDRVLAFGHPFLGHGRVQFPMATVGILNTLATPAGSYKQGIASLEVGSILDDRMSAIAGRVGQAAPMVPTKVSVTDRGREAQPKRTEVEIVDSPFWLPVLSESVFSSALARRLEYEAGGTIDMLARIQVGDRTLEIRDRYAGTSPTVVADFPARDLSTILSIIVNNPFDAAHVRAIETSFEVTPNVEFASLERVIADRTVIHAGEKLRLTARLRRHRDPNTFTVPLELLVPEDVVGHVEVYVGGGVELDRREAAIGGEPVPTTLDGILGVLADRRPARALYARVYVPRPGLRTQDEFFSSLPVSQRIVVAEAAPTQSQMMTEAFGPTIEVPLPGVIVGGTSLQIHVLR
ncbi:MAG: hypothetical protein IPK13_19275 [Deltaproteobacteria bacterium]|nr:hypothetical protein [Deltaproteobacteria bacterium]